MPRLRHIVQVALLAACSMASAQFKVVGPAPYPPAVAHQKTKALLEQVDGANRKQTIDTLTGLLSWYRDAIDDELIAGWQKDTRANLPEVMEALADSRVALAIVEISWRQASRGFRARLCADVRKPHGPLPRER